MPQFNLNQLTKKHYAFGLGTVIAIVVIGLISWIWWSNHTYTQQLQQQQADLSHQLQAIDTILLNTEDNNTVLTDQLSSFQTSLQQLANQSPTAPHILGYSLPGSPDQTEVQNRAAAFKQLDDQLTLSLQLYSYQHQLTPYIVKLQSGSGQTAQEQATLATTWHQAHQDISNLIVPQASQNFSQQLLETINHTAEDLEALAELYKQKKPTEFVNKRAELEARFAKLNQLAQDHQANIQAQDQQLAQAILRLQQAY